MNPHTRYRIVCGVLLSLGGAALVAYMHAPADPITEAQSLPPRPPALAAPFDFTQGETSTALPEKSSDANLQPGTVMSSDDAEALLPMTVAALVQPPTPSAPSADPHIIRLRERLHEAAALATAAAQGDASAQATVRDRLAHEPDPRIRSALTDGKIPALGEDLPNAIALPAATTAAEPGTYEGFWQYNNDACTSTITIDATGRATVETIQHNPALGGAPPYHVRYNGWAWRDASGNLIIDGRGQRVDDLLRPGHASDTWSPDSMTVTPSGLIDTIDDRRGAGLGTTGVSAVN